MRKLFLVIILLCLSINIRSEPITEKISLVKDQSIVYNYFGGVSSLNISGKDKNDKNWHWILYYKSFVGPKGLSFELRDIKQIKPKLDKTEIVMLQYTVKYETKVTSDLPKIFTMEDTLIKDNINVTVIYQKHENPIKDK